MSHFSILAVTNNGTEKEIEQILQPYHEFECTGLVDQYVESVDITEETKQDWKSSNQQLTFLEYIQEEYTSTSILQPGQSPDLLDKCKWGWAQLDKNEVSVVIKRTNRNKRWDWWQVGGRWSDSLLTKSGLLVDSCQYDQLDSDTQIKEAVIKAQNEWEWFQRQYTGVTANFETWSAVRSRIKDLTEARLFYHSQPLIKLTSKENSIFQQRLLATSYDVDNYTLPKSQYVEKSANNAFRFYAVVKDDQWHSAGRMGWWGISTDCNDSWPEEQRALLATVKPDQWVTVVDCHI
jgi:hypothetical protein